MSTYVNEANWTKFPNDQIQLWDGTITLLRDSRGDVGSIKWRQVKPVLDEHPTGMKRIILSDDAKEIHVIGEGGHGTERFERIPTSI